MWWWCWWCRVFWLCVYGGPRMAWTCVGGGCWLGCWLRVLWYGGGGERWWGRCCWCAPGVWACGGAAWLDSGPGRGAAPCWRTESGRLHRSDHHCDRGAPFQRPAGPQGGRVAAWWAWRPQRSKCTCDAKKGRREVPSMDTPYQTRMWRKLRRPVASGR